MATIGKRERKAFGGIVISNRVKGEKGDPKVKIKVALSPIEGLAGYVQRAAAEATNKGGRLVRGTLTVY